MLNDEAARLTTVGTVTISAAPGLRVVVEGFSGDGCTCRDVAVLAMTWAIGELQRELLATLQKAGGGSVGVG